MTDDKNSFSTRVKRYAQVSTSMTALAGKLLGQQYLGINIDRERHAKDLKNILGNLKGPLMKVAQLLSTVPDALPPEYTLELAQLQSNAPPMSWPFVKRRMKSELGNEWQKKFSTFERQAIAAASLGQVHQAFDSTGQQLACKLQYPDMQAIIEADLQQLKIILGLYEAYDKAIRTTNIHQEIAERLREELDYILEAHHIKLYSYMLRHETKVHVPKVIEGLSTRRLLTMTWLEGESLLNVRDRSLEERNSIARNMFRAWYVPFYHYGIIHGDPHLGNYSICHDGAINLMDFGCVRRFKGSFVKSVIDLYFALMNNDQDLAIDAYRRWGFKNLNQEIIDVLNLWARFLYGPVMQDKKRLIDDTGTGVYGRETAAKVHEELRRIGGVHPPAEFVFMDRAAVGLGSVFLHLKAELNWYREFHGLIEDFDDKEMEKKQSKAMEKSEMPEKF